MNNFTIKDLIKILADTHEIYPAPEISLIVGDNENVDEVKDFCLEWWNEYGNVDYSFYYNSDTNTYKKVLTTHVKLENEFYKCDDDTKIDEMLIVYLDKLYENY